LPQMAHFWPIIVLQQSRGFAACPLNESGKPQV
jgi:hypothetical protein